MSDDDVRTSTSGVVPGWFSMSIKCVSPQLRATLHKNTEATTLKAFDMSDLSSSLKKKGNGTRNHMIGTMTNASLVLRIMADIRMIKLPTDRLYETKKKNKMYTGH